MRSQVSIPSTTSGLFQHCGQKAFRQGNSGLRLNPFYNVRSIPTMEFTLFLYDIGVVSLNPFYNVRSIPTSGAKELG